MLIVHIIVGLIGAFLFALTFVMRESTEGVWVNRIEEFWIEVDDRKKSIGESTKILFRKIADKVSRAFNCVFGPKLISVRTIGMSGSLSFASFFLILAVIFEGVSYFIIKHSEVLKPELTKQVPLLAILGIGLFFVAGFCLLLAVLPILLKSPVWAWISCIPTVFLLELTYQLFHKHLGNAKEYGIALALAISFASDVLLLMLVRQSLRWILARTTLARIVSAMAMQLLALFLVFVIPYRLPIVWHPEMARSSVGQILFVLALFNIPTVVASLAFGFSLSVVLLHRLVWPFLSEFTYVLTRNEVLDKRKTVRWIGCACIVYAVSANHTFWYYLSQKLLK